MTIQHDEDYLSVLRDLIDNGYVKADRTGVGTRSRFGVMRRFDIRDGKIPLLTTKEVKHKSWRVENKWFLSGSGKLAFLLANGVKIWNNWIKKGSEVYRKVDDKDNGVGSPETTLVDADLGPVYGVQWRFWEDTRMVPIEDGVTSGILLERGYAFMGNLIDPATGTEKVAVYHKKFDQIAEALRLLREDPDSRRIIVSAWNPGVIADQALPACHTLFQFWTRELTLEERFEAGNLLFENAKRWYEHVGEELPEAWKKPAEWDQLFENVEVEGKVDSAVELLDKVGVPRRALSCMLYQRSSDFCLGAPFNLPQYATLTHMFARCVNMMADEFIWVAGDHHVYNDQVELAKGQLERLPTGAEPRVLIRPSAVCEDPAQFELDDIVIHGYEKGDYHPFIPYPVAV